MEFNQWISLIQYYNRIRIMKNLFFAFLFFLLQMEKMDPKIPQMDFWKYFL